MVSRRRRRAGVAWSSILLTLAMAAYLSLCFVREHGRGAFYLLRRNKSIALLQIASLCR